MSRKHKHKKKIVENEVVEDVEVSDLTENIDENSSVTGGESASVENVAEKSDETDSVKGLVGGSDSDTETSSVEELVEGSDENTTETSSVEELVEGSDEDIAEKIDETDSVEDQDDASVNKKPSLLSRFFSIFDSSSIDDDLADSEEIEDSLEEDEDLSEEVKDFETGSSEEEEIEFFESEEDNEPRQKKGKWFWGRSKRVDDEVVEEVDSSAEIEIKEESNEEIDEELEAELAEAQPLTFKESIEALKENLSSLHIILSALILVFISIAVLGCISFYKSYKYNKGIQASEKKGAVAWVNGFAGHSFEYCDNMVKSDQYKLLSPRIYFEFDDSDYYTIALNALADSIQGVELKTIKKTGNDKVYTFEVTVKVFEQIDDVNVYNFDKVKEEYISNKLGKSDVTYNLYEVYKNSYKDTCFNLSDETKIITLDLVESDDYVDNTTNFVKTLYLQTGLSTNLIDFEEKIKGAVDSEILEAE